MPWKSYQYDYYDDDYITWYEHFAKGFASMGVLGFAKTLLARPWHFLRFGGGRGRQTARDRYEQVGWVVILIGVGTFLYVSTRPITDVSILTIIRPYTKAFVHGVPVPLKRPVNVLWIYTAMMMMTMTNSLRDDPSCCTSLVTSRSSTSSPRPRLHTIYRTHLSCFGFFHRTVVASLRAKNEQPANSVSARAFCTAGSRTAWFPPPVALLYQTCLLLEAHSPGLTEICYHWHILIRLPSIRRIVSARHTTK